MTSTSNLSIRPPTVNEQDSASQPALKRDRVCRYFSKSGSCKQGSDCPFLHDDTRLPGAKISTNRETVEEMNKVSGTGDAVTEDGMIQDRRQATKAAPSSRVVTKPVPQAQAQDPREFQIGQIRRRFSPKESRNGSTTVLKFSLAPSDPDFPFEMTALECVLSIPAAYPRDNPSLKVANNDIPRGFAFNVEIGFDGLVEKSPQSTLLEFMKALDKNLEIFLSAPKTETVKLVANKDTRHLSATPSRAVEPEESQVKIEKSIDVPDEVHSTAPPKPVVHYSTEQKAEAAKRRESETRQLEARMGRLPRFKKSGDGIAYTIPIEPKRRAQLPISLQAVKSVQLFVPLLYPLQPCRIQLDGVDQDDATPIHVGFEKKAVEHPEMNLMGHVNYLVQNIHVLAKTVLEQKPVRSVQPPEKAEEPINDKGKGKEIEGDQDEDRGHIHYIARPVEWTLVSGGSGEDSDYETDDVYSYDTEDEFDDEDGGVGIENREEKPTESTAATQNPERGTAISFPFIELYGIELLEISVLNITVKCERCKETTEVKGLKDGNIKNESCRKCASPFVLCFRKDLVHANAIRAGFLDLDGCIIGDMLPSTFIPTCSTCSTAYPAPGFMSVQGETIQNVCRECHSRFTFKLPAVKFLRISATSHLASMSLPRKKKKETLGITPGTELPKRGRCRHYTKSYRWFRFSCCMKVYNCDKCHDAEEEHPHEWANRMICGWCSREGNYRPEDCGFCRGTLIGKKGGGGFWEGGKGTRDKTKMSRKDPRKYRRVGAAVKKS